MKKLIIPMLALALLMLACQKSADEYKPVPFTFDTNQKSLLKANNTFGADLFRNLNAEFTNENVFISPVSVSVALGMTLNGANNNTYNSIRDVLGYENMPLTEINTSYQSIISQLTSDDPMARLQIANSIWYKRGFSVLPQFIDNNKTYFLSEVKEADFADPATLKLINDWVAGKTNQKIQNILNEIPANAVMYLINAIYFKGLWKYEFKKEDTKPDMFLVNGQTNQQVQMMFQGGSFKYYEDEMLKAVEMPYNGERFSLVAFLPEEGKNIDTFIKEYFTDEYYSRIIQNMRATNLNISFPRVKMEFKTLLNDALSNMGMQVAFTNDADFTNIRTEGGLQISKIIHQSFVEINEEGTEAAAATVVEIVETSVPEIKEFKANRPFIFVIKDNTANSIVFVGKVVNPQ